MRTMNLMGLVLACLSLVAIDAFACGAGKPAPKSGCGSHRHRDHTPSTSVGLSLAFPTREPRPYIPPPPQSSVLTVGNTVYCVDGGGGIMMPCGDNGNQNDLPAVAPMAKINFDELAKRVDLYREALQSEEKLQQTIERIRADQVRAVGAMLAAGDPNSKAFKDAKQAKDQLDRELKSTEKQLRDASTGTADALKQLTESFEQAWKDAANPNLNPGDPSDWTTNPDRDRLQKMLPEGHQFTGEGKIVPVNR